MKRPKCKVCKRPRAVAKAMYQSKGAGRFCSMDCRIIYEREQKFAETRCPYCGEIEPFIGCRCGGGNL
jgi:hypothetical protein